MNLKTLKEKIGLLYNYNMVSSRKESAVEYVRRKCDEHTPAEAVPGRGCGFRPVCPARSLCIRQVYL